MNYLKKENDAYAEIVESIRDGSLDRFPFFIKGFAQICQILSFHKTQCMLFVWKKKKYILTRKFEETLRDNSDKHRKED